MSEPSNTPETDKSLLWLSSDDSCCRIYVQDDNGNDVDCDIVSVDFARRLERERDDARSLCGEITHGITHSPYCTPELPCLRCERDEAREALKLEQSRLWAAMLATQHAEDERDKALKELRELKHQLSK